MTGKTHLVAGACVGCIFSIATYSNPFICGGTLLLTMVGSLTPDIDQTQSMAGSKVKPFSTIINNLFGHRTVTHSPSFLLIVCLSLYFCSLRVNDFYTPLFLGFVFGYISHLCLDWLTVGGLPLLYPFSKKKFALTHSKSGSYIEPITLAIIMLITIIYIIYIFYITFFK